MNVKQKGLVSIMRYACTHVKNNVWVEKIFIVLGKECQRGSHHIHTPCDINNNNNNNLLSSPNNMI